MNSYCILVVEEEIELYRVWDIQNAKMLLWDEIKSWSMEKVLEDTDYIPMVRIGNDIASHIQGREEFEGDIIHGIYYSPFDSSKEHNGKEFYSVYTHDHYYPAYSIEYPWGSTEMIYFESASVMDLHIVGNVFENIELFEKIDIFRMGKANVNSYNGAWTNELLKGFVYSDRLKKLKASNWNAEVLMLYSNLF